MNPIKKLAGQTVIYGLSSIVPKFLTYFMVPLYTYLFKPAEYGVVGDLYGLVVMLNIMLTYGMETAYFWFSKSNDNADKVFSTSLLSLIGSSLLFIIATIVYAQPVADYLEYPAHPEYIWWFGVIIGVDAICAIPFVKLRRENKAMKFATIKLFNVGLNVLLTILFLIVFPAVDEHIVRLPSFLYSPDMGVGYIFIANIISSVATMLLLLKDFSIKTGFDFALWKKMLVYALPLLIAGLAGGVNDAIDRQFLKFMLPEGVNAMEQLGIYFANLKIAVILVVFIQTFRFAAEPFFFTYEKEKDSRQIFADIMKYFVLFCLVILVGTLANLSIIRYFIGSDYWSGLGVVPVVLFANLFVGIYVNLSIWYKLSGKTMYGAYIIVFGSLITIVVNYFFVSRYGYYASAYARLACYIIMTVVCFALGQKYYPIPYNLRAIAGYFLLTFVVLIPMYLVKGQSSLVQLVINNAALILLLYFIVKKEKLWPVMLKMVENIRRRKSA